MSPYEADLLRAKADRVDKIASRLQGADSTLLHDVADGLRAQAYDGLNLLIELHPTRPTRRSA